MGCGSSSLKGEKPENLPSGDAMPAARKVKTNFSDVDFSSGTTADRRGTMALAPDEQNRRSRRISEISEEAGPGAAPTGSETAPATGTKLEPYKSAETDQAMGETSLPPKKEEKKPVELPADTHLSNDEAATLATVGTSNANPIRVA